MCRCTKRPIARVRLTTKPCGAIITVACIIAPDNKASLGVAAKTGFKEVARTTYKGEPTVMLYREP